MTSPYLEQSLVLLGVALPQMLECIEAELANEKLEPVRKNHLRHRAELIHWLLAPRPTHKRRRQEGPTGRFLINDHLATGGVKR